MPHLSPMNWLMMLLSTIMILMTLNSLSWWNSSMKMKLNMKSKYIKNITWKW